MVASALVWCSGSDGLGESVKNRAFSPFFLAGELVLKTFEKSKVKFGLLHAPATARHTLLFDLHTDLLILVELGKIRVALGVVGVTLRDLVSTTLLDWL